MNDQLNVLWVLCDELRTDALSCYGGAPVPVSTPVIDSLAGSGVLFERAFATSPVCVPARVVMHTGLRPEQTGVYGNEAYADTFPIVQFDTLPQAFARAGWSTADFGKEHVPPRLQPWSLQDPTGSGMLAILAAVPDVEALDLLRSPSGGILAGRYPADAVYPPSAVVDRLLGWVEQQDGPWFARASFLQPHTPIIPPEPWASRYDGQAWPDEVTPTPTVSAFERRFGEICQADSMDPASRVRMQSAYHGTVAWIDDEIGRLLAGLEAQGQRKRTIVVFLSDHGRHLGERGALAKHTFSPPSQRIPFIVVHPDLQPDRRADLVEQLDVARTVCGLVGIRPPFGAGGRDLFSAPDDEPICSTIGFGEAESFALPNLGLGRWFEDHGWPRRSCVRSGQWRFDRNVRLNGRDLALEDPQADVFLADCHADPDETVNLGGLAEHASVVAELDAVLDPLRLHAVETPASLVYSSALPGARVI